MDRAQATPRLSRSAQHLLDWLTFCMTIHYLGTHVAFEFFQSQTEFRKLCPVHSRLWHLPQDANKPQFPQGCILPHPWSSSSIRCKPVYTCPLALQVRWIILPWLWTKVLGSVKITASFTRRKNELVERLWNKRTIFPAASRRCRNWYRWQAKRSMPAQRHPVMVSSTWSPSICSA